MDGLKPESHPLTRIDVDWPFSTRNAVRAIFLFWISVLAIFSLTSCASSHVKPQPYSASYAVASWYGPNFHGRPTSSGEPFNMYDLTCAHKELPFGSKLRVTNISNDKSVICVVNDRGPFIEGRDLDLSYASAKKIGLIGPGVGKVFVEYIERDLTYVKGIMVKSDTGPFTVQVGSFRDPSNATRLKTALGYRYHDVYIMESRIKGHTYYRVRIGRFDARGDVQDLADRLSDEGYPVLIITYERQA